MTKPLFLFAHGAGLGSKSPWMTRWTARLSALGTVVTFDYPYMQAGRRAPDPLPKLIAAHRAALDDARQAHTGPTFLIGKSMGSRVGCHVSVAEDVRGIICLGYPLVGAGKPGALRDQALLDLNRPVLFVQGTRDALCPLERLREVHARMGAPHTLHVVESGDHSLAATRTWLKANGKLQSDVDGEITSVIARFVDKYAT